jgi:hypothetical protein
MVSTDNQQWQGFWRWLVAGFISPKHLQALPGCFFYQILSLQAGKNFLLVKYSPIGEAGALAKPAGCC